MSYRWVCTVICCCVLEGVLLAPPAHAAHAYAMACCSTAVPSSVSVFNRRTHALANTFFVGEGAASVAPSKDGRVLFVINETDQSISVLSALNGVPIGTISLTQYGGIPYGLVLGPDGGVLYVTEVAATPVGPNSSGINVLGISTATNTVLFQVEVPGFANNGQVELPAPVISSDGRKLLVFAHSMVIFDLSTRQASAIPVAFSKEDHPQGLAVTPDGAYAAFTFNGPKNTGQFSLMDVNTQAVVKQLTYPTGTSVSGVAVSPDGSQAYFATNSSTGSAVNVFDIASQQVVNTFPAGSGGAGLITVTPDGSEIELGEGNNSVLSMNTVTGAVVAETGVLGELTSIALSADSAWVYATNYSSSVVEIIDPDTLQITKQLAAGAIEDSYDVPWTITASRDGRRIVVAARVNLTVIDAVSQRVLGAVPYGAPFAGPIGVFGSVSLSPHGDRAYVVVNTTPAQIQVVDTSQLKTVAALSLTAAEYPTQSAVSPDSSTLYVGEQYCTSGQSCDCYFDSCLPRLLQIDTATLEITGQVALGARGYFPGGIALTRDGKTAYVEGLPSSGGISVVNLTAGAVDTTIPNQLGWQPIALSPNQQFIYEATLSNCDYYSIGLATQQVTCVGAPGNGGDVAVSPNGAFVFSSSGNSVLAVAASPDGSGTYLGTVSLPGASNGVAFSPF